MARTLREIAAQHPGDRVAIVSHGDPIRYALADFLGLPVAAVHRFRVDTGSASTVAIDGPDSARILCINHDGRLPLG